MPSYDVRLLLVTVKPPHVRLAIWPSSQAEEPAPMGENIRIIMIDAVVD